MRKEKILEILENAKDGNGDVPMRLVRTAFDKLSEPCEDTISRQAAIDAAKHAWAKGLEPSQYIEIISPAQPEPQWILCDERMPEEHEWLGTKKFGTTISDEVYVTFENEKGERFCRHMHFQNGKLSSYDQFHMDTWFKGSKPIAWMPLPKPFKPEERKDGEANAKYRD